MLKRWIMPRCGGKTTALVRESSETGATIVTFSTSEELVKYRAKELGLTIKDPISYTKFLQTYNNSPKNEFLIDELNCFLKYLHIVGYSNTSDE